MPSLALIEIVTDGSIASASPTAGAAEGRYHMAPDCACHTCRLRRRKIQSLNACYGSKCEELKVRKASLQYPNDQSFWQVREISQRAMCGRLRVGKNFFHASSRWSVQPCVRPVSAVHMTAGHNALRGSGPGQFHAFDHAVARVGCPDRRIDRLCITCCSSLPTVHITPPLPGAICFTPLVRRVPCSAPLSS